MPSSRGSSQPRDRNCVSYVSTSLALADRFFTTSSHHLMAQMVKNLPAMQETQVRSLGWEDSLEEEMRFLLKKKRIQLPMEEILEIQVQFLVQENPLEEGMATYSSILAWRIPWTEEPGRLQSIGLQSLTQLKRLSMQGDED